jgi:hypothetical protein
MNRAFPEFFFGCVVSVVSDESIPDCGLNFDVIFRKNFDIRLQNKI